MNEDLFCHVCGNRDGRHYSHCPTDDRQPRGPHPGKHVNYSPTDDRPFAVTLATLSLQLLYRDGKHLLN